MRCYKLFIPALISFVCLPVAQADEKPQVLNEVVVTAAGYVQPVEEIIPSVIVIDRETIERNQPAGIADLLRWHAGLDIGRTGGFGQQTSVFLRGTNSNHTAVLVNGVKMNSAATGAAALAMIDTSSIERIEIIKGPRSTVYGSEAIGGVINIITSAQQPYNKAELRLSDGRYSTMGRGVDLSYANDYWSGRFAFNRFDTGGFPARSTSTTNHGHDNDTISFDVDVKPGIGRLGFSYWQAAGNTEYSGYLSDLDQDHKNEVLHATFSLPLSKNWQSSLSVSKTKDELLQNQASGPGAKDFAFTDRVVYDWKNDLSIANNSLVFGVSGTDEDTESLSYGRGYKEGIDIWSVYIRNQWAKDSQVLFTSARYTNHEDFNEVITWNFEYGYHTTDATRIFAGLGTGFRAPDSNARFGFGGNPDLREETSRSAEVGMSHDFNPNTKVSLRAFENKVENLIMYSDGRNRNVDKARIRGIELSLQHQYKQWEAYLEGIMQNPRNEKDNTPLLRRAKRTLTAGLTYQRELFFVTLHGLLTSQRRDIGDSGKVTSPGYGLFNLSAGVDFPYATLSLKVDNLLDKDYELASGYNVPGRYVSAELRFRFTE